MTRIWLVVAGVVGLTNLSLAADSKNNIATAALRKCGRAYQRLRAVSLRTTMVMELAESGRTRRSETQATLLAERPNRFALKFDADEARGELRSDGVKLITYRAEGNEYLQAPVPADFGGKSLLRQPLRLSPGTSLVLNLLRSEDPTLFLNADLNGAELLKSETIAGRRTQVIALKYPWEKIEKGLEGKTGKALRGHVAEMKLWIDERDGLVRRVQVDLASAVKAFSPQRAPTRFMMTDSFSEVRVDPKLEAKAFDFAPPSGAKLVKSFSRATPRALVGSPAPTFKLNDTSGRGASLSDFKGKTVLVNLWATA